MTRPPTDADTRLGTPVAKRRLALVVVAVYVLQGFLLFGYRFFEARVDDPNASFAEPLVNEVTGAIGGLLLFPIVFWLCVRYRLGPGIWWKAVAVHAVALPLSSVAHTLMNWAFRTALYPVFAIPGEYGALRVRFAQEFFNDVWGYGIVVVLVYGFLYYRDTRTREFETARLQTELGRAKLRDLQARLHPHFLFNTLNTISAHVADDPAAAERMIEQLSTLLRRSLSASGMQETTVLEEVETLELYLGIMTERTGDRIQASVEIKDGAAEGVIPTLLLQPLVENAIEHGLGPRANGGRVAVRIERNGGRLIVVVEDDGVGLASDPAAALGAGFGLSATAERVHRLYGDQGRLEIARVEPGTRVTVEIPWQRGGSSTAVQS